MYFKAMPKLLYPVPGNQIVVKDIFRRIGLDRSIKSKTALTSYYLQDGDTPESISFDFYGSTNYHWIVLITNDIINVKTEWPKLQNSLFEYTESKYGVGNATEVHHYRITDSDPEIIVDYDSAKLAAGTIQSITNYAYEEEVNESKKEIFLLKPEFVKQFIATYKKLMAQ